MNTGRVGRVGRAGRAGWLILALASVPVLAQSHEIDFTAVSANVKQPGIPVRIRLNRWSTEAERSLGGIRSAQPRPPQRTPRAVQRPGADGAAGDGGAAGATPRRPRARSPR